MADEFRIEVDPAPALRALDELGALAERYAIEAAVETGHAVQSEGRNRLDRQTSGTGQTARNITVSQMPAPSGAWSIVVWVQPINRPENLPQWLEFGTSRMTPRPFLFASANLERGPHHRRSIAALERAAREAGR